VCFDLGSIVDSSRRRLTSQWLSLMRTRDRVSSGVVTDDLGAVLPSAHRRGVSGGQKTRKCRIEEGRGAARAPDRWLVVKVTSALMRDLACDRMVVWALEKWMYIGCGHSSGFGVV